MTHTVFIERESIEMRVHPYTIDEANGVRAIKNLGGPGFDGVCA